MALSRALLSLGEDTLYEDSCRLELAPRTLDSSLCDPITEGPLRSACLARSAMATGSPALCPPAPGLLGRDPVCVAIAARAPGLCAAAMLLDRQVCLALARLDPRPCALLEGLSRPRCESELQALQGVLSAMPRVNLLPDGNATLRADLAASDAAVLDRPLRLVTHGVWLDASGSVWLVDPLVGTRVAALDAAPAMAVQIFSPRPRARVSALCRLAMPGEIDRDAAWLGCEATLRVCPRGRGDRAVGEVLLSTRWQSQALRVRLVFDSFVRDIIDPLVFESP